MYRAAVSLRFVPASSATWRCAKDSLLGSGQEKNKCRSAQLLSFSSCGRLKPADCRLFCPRSHVAAFSQELGTVRVGVSVGAEVGLRSISVLYTQHSRCVSLFVARLFLLYVQCMLALTYCRAVVHLHVSDSGRDFDAIEHHRA